MDDFSKFHKVPIVLPIKVVSCIFTVLKLVLLVFEKNYQLELFLLLYFFQIWMKEKYEILLWQLAGPAVAHVQWLHQGLWQADRQAPQYIWRFCQTGVARHIKKLLFRVQNLYIIIEEEENIHLKSYLWTTTKSPYTHVMKSAFWEAGLVNCWEAINADAVVYLSPDIYWYVVHCRKSWLL